MVPTSILVYFGTFRRSLRTVIPNPTGTLPNVLLELLNLSPLLGFAGTYRVQYTNKNWNMEPYFLRSSAEKLVEKNK
jgi:hypothetical protein